jgi:hypothetical protein
MKYYVPGEKAKCWWGEKNEMDKERFQLLQVMWSLTMACVVELLFLTHPTTSIIGEIILDEL